MRQDWKKLITERLIQFQRVRTSSQHDPSAVIEEVAEAIMRFSEMVVDEALSRHVNIAHRQNDIPDK